MIESDGDAEALTLSERQAQILRAVCRDYLLTGDAVASSALVRRHGFRWSSATLRQELAALERLGLLRRPHRSAGCSPTELGLHHYVQSLPLHEGARPEFIHAVDRSLQRVRDDPRQGMRATVCVLSEASGCLAVSFVGTAHRGQMEQVDVVPLTGSRVLVVLTMDGGATHVQPVELDAVPDGPQASVDRHRLEERLRQLCVGRTLLDARRALLRRLGEHEAQADRLLAQALRVGLSVCAVNPLDPLWMQMAGQPALARGLPDTGRLGEILGVLDDDQRLAEVLDQLLPASADDGPPRAQVYVGVRGLIDAAAAGGSPRGPAAPDPRGAPGLSLVGCRVPMTAGGPDRGAVALLGSARMDYAAMIPLVEYAARALAARMCA